MKTTWVTVSLLVILLAGVLTLGGITSAFAVSENVTLFFADNLTLEFTDNTTLTLKLSDPEGIIEEAARIHAQILADEQAATLQAIIGLIIILLLISLAYWHRDKILYILAGLALLAYGAMQFSDNIYIGLLLIILGIYNFIKAAWDRR